MARISHAIKNIRMYSSLSLCRISDQWLIQIDPSPQKRRSISPPPYPLWTSCPIPWYIHATSRNEPAHLSRCPGWETLGEYKVLFFLYSTTRCFSSCIYIVGRLLPPWLSETSLLSLLLYQRKVVSLSGGSGPRLAHEDYVWGDPGDFHRSTFHPGTLLCIIRLV